MRALMLLPDQEKLSLIPLATAMSGGGEDALGGEESLPFGGAAALGPPTPSWSRRRPLCSPRAATCEQRAAAAVAPQPATAPACSNAPSCANMPIESK
jgi:hypothetical protein